MTTSNSVNKRLSKMRFTKYLITAGLLYVVLRCFYYFVHQLCALAKSKARSSQIHMIHPVACHVPP